MSRSPAAEYRRLNKLLWAGRLPKATVWFIDDNTMPTNHGITMWDVDFALPIILINSGNKHWKKTLVHECLHVAAPTLPHGWLFDTIVNFYWRKAKRELKDFQ